MSLTKVQVASGALVKVQIDGTVEADSLSTTGAAVDVSAAAPGVAGDRLTLTSPTTAVWQTPAAGGGGLLVAGTGTDSLKSDTGTTTSTATESIAIGVDADSTANYATALGSHAQATGANSVAIGGNSSTATAAEASATNAIALGNNSIASATESIAIGRDSQALDPSTIAIGYGAVTDTTSDNAVAIGRAASATGVSSIGIGTTVTASATNAVSIGESSGATGSSSVAIGSGSIATAASAVALGGGVATVNASLFLTAALATLGSGTELLFSGGQIAPKSSTRRIKDEIEPLGNFKPALRKLQPRAYRLKHQNVKGIGFIAEEVAEVAPELAEWGHWRTLDENGQQTGEVEEELTPVGVKYSDINVAMLGWMQELEKRVEALEAK